MRRLRLSKVVIDHFSRVFVAAICLVGFNACDELAYPKPDDSDQSRAITQALVIDSEVWLLEENGTLVSLSPENGSVFPTNVGGEVLAICKSQNRLIVLTDNRGFWKLKQLSDGNWTELGSGSARNERLIAMSCAEDERGASILTESHLIELVNGGERPIRLSQDISLPNAKFTALISRKFLWLAIDSGEWGG